jgi:hypothetical protein
MSIICIKGNVKYAITLDPSVWIFDDRKFLFEPGELPDKKPGCMETEPIDHERQIREGKIFPPTLQSEKKFEKQKLMKGTFAIDFQPFLNHADPAPDASRCVFHSSERTYSFSLTEARELILFFSDKGKPLQEGGPIHVYHPNREKPVTHVTEIEIM